MRSRLSRIRPGRAAPPPPADDDPPPSTALEEPDPAPALPAGVDPVAAATRGPGTRERGRIRRRLRYLVRLREVQLRDLGGLVFDIHRFGAQAEAPDRARHAGLVRAKVAELDALDSELRALDGALGGGQSGRELREAGIGGACERCGALHGSEARFCSACGAPVGRGAEGVAEGNGVPAQGDPLDVRDGPER
jgi:hypothetical protein